jgi:hypothetical protein
MKKMIREYFCNLSYFINFQRCSTGNMHVLPISNCKFH